MLYQKILPITAPYVIYLLTGFNKFPLHRHYEIEIIYCRKGSFPLLIEGKKFVLNEGELAIIGSMLAHEIPERQNTSEMLLLEFGPLFLRNAFQTLSKVEFSSPVISICKDEKPTSEIKAALEEICSSANLFGAENELSQSANLYKICENLLLLGVRKEGIKNRNNISRFENVLNYIHLHYTENITVDEASRLAGYSKGNFCKAFKKATGMSFHRYLNNYRIQSSLYLLTETDIPIGAVADAIGFPEFKSFCRVFKDIMGVTPSEFRKEV